MQPIEVDARGVIRFRANAIIRDLVRSGSIDLNKLAAADYSDEDHMQLAQLIGYSVSGYGDLSYASKESVSRADRIAAKLYKKLNGGAE